MKNERLEMRVELSRVLPHPLVRINSPLKGGISTNVGNGICSKTYKKQIKVRKTLTSEPLDKMA